MRYEWFEEVSSISSNDIREQHERARPFAADDEQDHSYFFPSSGPLSSMSTLAKCLSVLRAERFLITNWRVVDFLDNFSSF